MLDGCKLNMNLFLIKESIRVKEDSPFITLNLMTICKIVNKTKATVNEA